MTFSWFGVSIQKFCTSLISNGESPGSWNHDSFEEDSEFKPFPPCSFVTLKATFSMKYEYKQYLRDDHVLFKSLLDVILVSLSCCCFGLAFQKLAKKSSSLGTAVDGFKSWTRGCCQLLTVEVGQQGGWTGPAPSTTGTLPYKTPAWLRFACIRR